MRCWRRRPAPAPSGPARPWQLLVLSARSAAALDATAANLARHLAEHPEENLPDVAWTLQAGRRGLCPTAGPWSAADAATPGRSSRLRTPAAVAARSRGRRPAGRLPLPRPRDHYVDMAGSSTRPSRSFAKSSTARPTSWRRFWGSTVRELIFAGNGKAQERRRRAGPTVRTSAPCCAAFLEEQQTRRSPAVANRSRPAGPLRRRARPRQLLLSWGIRPAALIGYSIGEYVAACLAGVMSLEDALTLVAFRAQRIAELPPGAMLAIPLPESRGAAVVREPSERRPGARCHQRPAPLGVGGTVEAVARLEAALAGRPGEGGCPCASTHHASTPRPRTRPGAVPRRGAEGPPAPPGDPFPVERHRHLGSPTPSDRPRLLGPAHGGDRAASPRVGRAARRSARVS